MYASTRLMVAALMTALVASACGSTALRQNAALGSGTAVTGGTTGGAAVDGGTGSTVVGTTTGGTPASTTGTGVAQGSGGGTGGFATSGTGATTGTAGSAGSKATSKAPIRLGVVGVDATKMAAAFGDTKNYSSAVFADSKAMIDYVNKHGGIAGRQLKPVYVSEDISKDSQQAGQDACSQLTEDNKVDIVLSQQFSSETLYTCLKQRGISIFNASIFAPDVQYTSQYSNNYLPGGLRADRYGPAAITTALASGLLKKGDKLGILIEDCPWGLRIYNNVLAPLAKRNGVSVEIGTVTCVNNLVEDLTPVTNDVQRDTLKFHQDGVTHVLTISGAEGFMLTVFTTNASQQHYFPKYVIASSGAHLYNNSRQDSKAAVHFSPDALPNMRGIAFRPLDDVGAARAKPASAAQAAAQARCKSADPGRKPDADPENEGFARDQWYTLCDAFFALVETLELNGVTFGLGDVAAGYHAMLGRSASAGAVGGHYAGGKARLDGIGLVQQVRFDPGSKHFVYVGAPISVT